MSSKAVAVTVSATGGNRGSVGGERWLYGVAAAVL